MRERKLVLLVLILMRTLVFHRCTSRLFAQMSLPILMGCRGRREALGLLDLMRSRRISAASLVVRRQSRHE